MLPTVVLAAGLGTRLRPLTDRLAKPAVPVAGVPLITRVLQWLQREGVRDTAVNLHHLPATVTGRVGDGSAIGLRVRYSWERQVLGSAGGPRRALDVWPGLSTSLLIVNGDTLTDFPLRPMIDAHAAARADGGRVTMAVVRNTRPDHYNGIRIDAERRVRGFVPRGHTEETWHFIGVQVIEPDVLAGVSPDEPSETVAGLYRTLVDAEPGAIRVWPVDAPFLDIGTPDDYLDACFALASPEARAARVIIESPWDDETPPAQIAADARLTDCVVWPGASVASGVQLERCVVMREQIVQGRR